MTNPSLDYYRSQRFQSACMGFAGRPEGECFTWKQQLQVPFRALGILVWGVTNDTLIHEIMVGCTSQLRVSGAGFPARFFEAGFSFAELTDLFSNPEAVIPLTRALQLASQVSQLVPHQDWFTWLKKHPQVAAHQRIELGTCNPGVSLSVTCSGPIGALAIWGNALR